MTREFFKSIGWSGEQFTAEQLPITQPGPTEVQVRIVACGVCMSEVHFVEGLNDAFELPPKLGHEFGGIVEAVGTDVSDLSIGALVGNAGSFGGFGEVVVASAEAFYPIARTVPPHHSSFLEPVSACVRAVQRSRISLGESVLITGAGTNGLLILQLVRRSGAARVVVSEPDETRRTLALRLGADEAIDPGATPLAEIASSQGVDVAIETSGNANALQDCLDAVAAGGRVVMFGVSADSVRLELPLFAFHLRDIELIASMGFGVSDSQISASLLPVLELEPLITHRFGLDDVGAAFACARRGEGVKILVNCS